MRKLALLTTAFLFMAGPAFAFDTLNVTDTAKGVAEGKLLLIDIRTPQEWAETGVAGPATPLDMTDPGFMSKLEELMAANAGKEPAFICRSGNRSGQLVQALEQVGMSNVATVAGGTRDWIGAGLPLRKVD